MLWSASVRTLRPPAGVWSLVDAGVGLGGCYELPAMPDGCRAERPTRLVHSEGGVSAASPTCPTAAETPQKKPRPPDPVLRSTGQRAAQRMQMVTFPCRPPQPVLNKLPDPM